MEESTESTSVPEGSPPSARVRRRGGSRGLWWRVAAGTGALGALAVGMWGAPDPDAAPPPERAVSDMRGSATTTTEPSGPTTYTTVPPTWEHDASPRVDPAILDGLAFTDATRAAGLDQPHLNREPDGTNDMSGGAAAADYDDDGDLDVYVTRVGLPNLLYRNDGDGTFTDVADVAGVEGPEHVAGYAGAVWADVDGDDDLDLWVTSVGHAANVLFVNQGDGTFTDETENRGLTWPEVPEGTVGANTFSSAFADWDGDGDLDLAVADWYTAPIGTLATGGVPGISTEDVEAYGTDVCRIAAAARVQGFPVADGLAASRTRLLTNDGTGRFTDATETLGIDPRSMAAFSLTFADYDDDGWPDLFVGADFCTSRLFHNDGGKRFVDVTTAAGLGTDENGMGQAVEDLDRDGDLDWILSAISFPPEAGSCPLGASTIGCSGNRVFLNQGGGRFTDATDRYGVRDAFWGWGVVAADLTNTGHRDLAITAGYTNPDGQSTNRDRPSEVVHRRSEGSPSRLWRNTGDTADKGPWPEVADQVGFRNRGNGKALVAFDYDDDGDLDLLEVNTEAPPVLHRNETPSGAGHHWVRISLRDTGSPNRRAVGAGVTVVASDGRRTRAEVRAGDGFQGSGPVEVHVGLGDAGSVREVAVRWPGSATPEVFDHVAIDTTTTLTRGEGAPR